MGLGKLIILAVVLFVAWASLCYLMIAREVGMPITLAVTLGGPFLLVLLIGFVFGLGQENGGARAGAAAGVVFGALSQIVGYSFRSTEGFVRWTEGLSRSLAAGSQTIVSVSARPQAGELALGVVILTAVGALGGWTGNKLRRNRNVAGH